jgi:hypothetical protein
MRRRRASIPPRTPVFLGCEGESEQAYGRLLSDLARDLSLPIHIEVVTLNPGAGDPSALLRRAKQEIDRRSKRRSEFRFAAVLIDSDRVEREPQLRQTVETFALDHGISIVWQQPCHEALLLRHFDGFATRRPPTAALSTQRLIEIWPNYRKPATKQQLARQISLEGVRRAATQDSALAAFLERIGLIN